VANVLNACIMWISLKTFCSPALASFADAKHLDFSPSHIAYNVLFGASLSEPHINGTSMREFYMYVCMVRPSREIYAQHGSMDISAKYSVAHSHAWVTGRIYAALI
jgi:hypothetical protein